MVQTDAQHTPSRPNKAMKWIGRTVLIAAASSATVLAGIRLQAGYQARKADSERIRLAQEVPARTYRLLVESRSQCPSLDDKVRFAMRDGKVTLGEAKALSRLYEAAGDRYLLAAAKAHLEDRTAPRPSCFFVTDLKEATR